MRIVLVSVLKKNRRKKKRKRYKKRRRTHLHLSALRRRPQTTEIKKMTTKITTKKKTKKKTARKQQLRIKNSTGRFPANPLI